MAREHWLWAVRYEVARNSGRDHGTLMVASRYGALSTDHVATFERAVAKREAVTTDEVFITKAESRGVVHLV